MIMIADSRARRVWRRFGTVVAVALFLTGCETPSMTVFPELTFAHLGPIRFDAGAVEIVHDYRSPMRAPNVEHRFPVRPAAAAERWGRDRLRAAGAAQRRVRLIVKKASVVEVPLKKAPGVRGYFTRDQAARYDAVLDVMIEVMEGPTRSVGYARAQATRSQTVPEDVTIAARERIWFKLIENLMTDLDVTLEQNIRQHLARFLR